MSSSRTNVGTVHYVEQTVYKVEKALVAAKFNGVALNKQVFDAKKTELNSINPTGTVPFLQTETGVIFSSNAIARYVARCRADTGLYGNSFDEEGHIDTWMDFCTHEVEIPLMTWLYPVLGLMKDAPQATEAAKVDVAKAIKQMEERLKVSDFIAGDSLTLADIVLTCALKEGFARIFDPAFRKPFPKATQWFERCVAMPQFKAVVGDVKLCTQASKPAQVASPKAKAEKQPAAKKEAAPKKDASPKAKPAAAKAAAAPAVSGGDAEAQIKDVGDQIRTLKEKLKADGLSGKKINDHEEIKALVTKLQELKAQAEAAPAAKAASPKASPKSSPKGSPKQAAASGGGDVEAQVKAVGDDIRVLKERLKGEGLSGKKINDHAEVKALVSKLQDLKTQLPA